MSPSCVVGLYNLRFGDHHQHGWLVLRTWACKESWKKKKANGYIRWALDSWFQWNKALEKSTNKTTIKFVVLSWILLWHTSPT